MERWKHANQSAEHQRRSREGAVRKIHDRMRTNPGRVGMQLREVLQRVPCESIEYEYEVKDDDGWARWYSARIVIRGKSILIDAFTPRWDGGGTPNEEKARRKNKVEWCEKHNIPYLPMSIRTSQLAEIAIRDFVRRITKGAL
jgi:hypothetical protein